MAKENYVEGCSMQRQPLLEADGFCFWKTPFETYVKSKDIDLWKVIQYGDFVFTIQDTKTKLLIETPFIRLKDDEKTKLGKNNEANMTLYNALPCKKYEQMFMCKTAKEIWHTLTITHQASQGSMQSLATLHLDELIDNLKVYEMVLENDDVVSKTTDEKVKLIALKAKVGRGQASSNSIWISRVLKVQDINVVATIAVTKITSYVIVQSPKKTRCSLEGHGVIVKMAINQTKARHVSYKLTLKSTYLNGVIDEEVYTAQPPGFINFQKPNHVYKLKKALYGLKQAPKAWKRVFTLDKDNESVDSTKYRGMISSLHYLTARMPNSEESVNRGEVEESSKKLKRKFKTMKGYEGGERVMFEFIFRDISKSEIWDKVKVPLSLRLYEHENSICCENTTHMMNGLKESRMESTEMLLSIHHGLKMPLNIISKMNKKLEEEKIKMNDKGKGKENDF
ncbi:zf-CCHC domain-containing protein [Tanacetum coccineum]